MSLNRVHLGNIRLSYTNTGTAATPIRTITEENNYYPFGLSHKGYNNVTSGYGNSAAKKYKFGGKELQDDVIGGNSLDWYDFHARNYDAALGRWMNIDPLAEFMWTQSPYNFAFNNPLFFIDPDGKMPIEAGTCPEGSCADNPIVLDEVVITASKKGSENFDAGNSKFNTLDGVRVWSNGREDRGPSGNPLISIDTNDLPPFVGRRGASAGSVASILEELAEFMKLITEAIDVFEKIYTKPNTSTMENKVEEEAKILPKNIILTVNKSALRNNGRTPYSVTWEEDTLVDPNSNTSEILERYNKKSDSIQKLIHKKPKL